MSIRTASAHGAVRERRTTMINDEERRAVARRLSDNALQDMDWLIPWAVFNDAEQHASEAVVRRLADLIEPSCDSDALLALADEMDSAGEDGLLVRDSDLMAWADRIREALGADDGR